MKAEGEKFGEDIKFLADFTSGQKKFEPWIEAAESKRAKGMAKPTNLQEALAMLDDAKVSEERKTDLERARPSRILVKIPTRQFDHFIRRGMGKKILYTYIPDQTN